MEDPAAPGAGSPPTNGNGNGSGKGKPAAPKGREAFRSQRRESEVRSPEGFQLGPGDTRGGRRRLRCFGRVPLRRPEPPARPEPPLKAGTCGASRSLNSGLCRPSPSPPVSCCGSGASRPSSLPFGGAKIESDIQCPRYFQIFISLHRCSPLKWEFVRPAYSGGNRRGVV